MRKRVCLKFKYGFLASPQHTGVITGFDPVIQLFFVDI
jgi:hypothetical protein